MLGKRILRWLRRHSWAIVTVILGIVAYVIIRTVIFVDNGAAPELALELFVPSDVKLDSDPVVYYDSTPRGYDLRIDVKGSRGSVKFVMIGLPNEHSCDAEGDGHGSRNLQVKKFSGLGSGAYSSDAAYVASFDIDNLTGDSITCHLASAPQKETFNRAKVKFDMYPDQLVGLDFKRQFRPMKQYPYLTVNVDVSGIEDVSLVGGTSRDTQTGDEHQRTLSEPDHRADLEVSWHDTVRTEQRDLALVLIGAILGLAATTFLEWVRPWMATRE